MKRENRGGGSGGGGRINVNPFNGSPIRGMIRTRGVDALKGFLTHRGFFAVHSLSLSLSPSFLQRSFW